MPKRMSRTEIAAKLLALDIEVSDIIGDILIECEEWQRWDAVKRFADSLSEDLCELQKIREGCLHDA